MEREHKSLETFLTGSPIYKLGEPILITFEIKNTSNKTYQILKWDTPLEQKIYDDFLTLQYDGQTLAYDGKFVKRGNPSLESYAIIRPGEQLKETVDISKVYPIYKPGDYTATLTSSIKDVFTITGNTKEAPRSRQNHEPHSLDSPKIHFKVIEDGQPKLTLGELARQENQIKKISLKAQGPNFNGGTSTQQADTIIAHNNAQHFAELSASQLQGTAASTNSLYQEWFGAFDQTRYDTVSKHYTDISNTLNSEQVTYDLSGTSCPPDTFAYTHKGDRTIWLCGLYLNAPQSGIDCKFGTLVHEWSHAVCSTDDNAYGEPACHNLATTDPSTAICNADSHEYFAEHLAQSTPKQ